MTLIEQVADTGGMVGLLLALDTLFTAEQARLLIVERDRPGGMSDSNLHRVRLVTTVLLFVTLAAMASLAPLVVRIVSTIPDGEWVPSLAIFVLTWCLLVGLVAWQVQIVRGARNR